MNRIFKTGKKPATRDRRDLLFAGYRTSVPILPPHPAQFGHDNLISAWGMNGNGPDDTVAPGFQGAGDCVFAGGAHETRLWNAEAGRTVVITGKESIADYAAVTGYDPQTGGNDEGTSVRDALKYRQKTGLLDAAGHRHKIGAYLALEAGNWEQMLEAAFLFGAVGIGIDFPESAMDQFDAGQPWDVVPGALTDGGHYVSAVRMGDQLYVVTWGREQAVTRAFYEQYNDEAWAIVSPEALSNGVSPEGFDLPTLVNDLRGLKGLENR